jgi:hypothetical protein
MVEKVTSGATGALGRISMTDSSGGGSFDVNDLAGMIENVTAGATSALGYISMTGSGAGTFDASDLSGMMAKITAGATGALGNISMDNYTSANLELMVSKVTAGATGALGKIKQRDGTDFAGYSSDNLTSMVEQVSAGATGALGKISMTGSGAGTFDSTDLKGMMEKINAGAGDGLANIIMDDYSPDNVSHLTIKIKSGGSGALGDIRMEGYNHDNISSTYTNAFTTAYDGTYNRLTSTNSVCTILDSTSSAKYTVVFSGTNLKEITKDYNGGCSAKEGEHVSYSTFVLGDNVTVTKNSDNSSVSAQKITKTKTKHTYMVMNADGLNSASACGFSDWEANVAKDISSVINQTGCASGLPAIGTVDKTVILMIGSDLWMGDNDNGSKDSDNFYSRLKDTGLDKE